mmetsp:Transcript_74617/g.147820  ORF Transcript_74617/g.147820 Transcript_74617/m.147820 type:complete len:91 (-) Transcript_74617:167-439(-)
MQAAVTSGFVQHRHEHLGNTFMNQGEHIFHTCVQRPMRRSHSFTFVAHDHKTVDTSYVIHQAAARAAVNLVVPLPDLIHPLMALLLEPGS